jgi:chemotaxis family two-component system response regulator Rcp1
MATNARHVLLVDDNPADIDLTSEALSRGRFPNHVSAVADGIEAMAYLCQTGRYHDMASPDLVILDLNLPKKDGRSVLAAVKSDPKLRNIPVVIFSTSRSQKDIGASYALGANSYISKPGNLNDYVSTITAVGEYWFGTAQLPEKEEQ